MPVKPYTIERFINICNKKHNFKYDYSKSIYINSRIKIVIVCPFHGEFKINPASHISGAGCALCRNLKNSIDNTFTQDKFLEKVIKVHGLKYDYSQTNYTNTRSKVKIICPIHGLFIQKAHGHLRGNGCRKCGINNRTNLNKKAGYSKTEWIYFCKDKLSYIYLVKLYNDTETFYKIGITQNPTYRFRDISYKYNLETIVLKPSINAGIIFDCENIIHNLLKTERYKPKIKFSGFTECFNYNQNVTDTFLKITNDRLYS